MKKTGFWSSDWFFGLLIVLLVFGLSRATHFFDALETKANDWGVSATSKQPSDRIAVIAIDEQSLANIGRWPWPRDIHAAMIDKWSAAKVKVIGSTIFYFEPQQDPGLLYITKLLQVYAKNVPAVAEGVTTVYEPHHVDRGYEGFVGDLGTLGADVTRIEVNHLT